MRLIFSLLVGTTAFGIVMGNAAIAVSDHFGLNSYITFGAIYFPVCAVAVFAVYAEEWLVARMKRLAREHKSRVRSRVIWGLSMSRDRFGAWQTLLSPKNDNECSVSIPVSASSAGVR